MASTETQKIRVWDLPTRLFHWVLLACTVGSFISAKIGGNAMKWHFYFGYCILTLLIFRVLWGIFGSKYARFSSFLPNPILALQYLKGKAAPRLGHNPLSAFSVYALLFAFAFQAITGLFSNDDIASEGPLYVKVSKDASDFVTDLHELNEKVIMLLVITHLLAIVFYHRVKKQRLVSAMITGDAQVQSTTVQNPQAATDNTRLRLRALVLLCFSAACVWFIVNKV